MEIRGDIVKQIRKDKGWTQAHLAEVCDVNLRTIQRVENQGSASVETIMALCVAFDVKRQVLFKVPEEAEIQSNPPSNTKMYVTIFLSGLIIGVSSTLVPFLFFT